MKLWRLIWGESAVERWLWLLAAAAGAWLVWHDVGVLAALAIGLAALALVGWGLERFLR